MHIRRGLIDRSMSSGSIHTWALRQPVEQRMPDVLRQRRVQVCRLEHSFDFRRFQRFPGRQCRRAQSHGIDHSVSQFSLAFSLSLLISSHVNVCLPVPRGRHHRLFHRQRVDFLRPVRPGVGEHDPQRELAFDLGRDEKRKR